MSSVIRNTLASVAVAAALLPAVASAQDAKNQGYLVDSQGQSAVVKAPVAGVCVRTSDWTPARAVEECDPDLVKKPAPAAAKPAPAPAPKPKAAAKPKKPAMVNVEQKIELQGMPFGKAEMTADNKKELDKFLAGLGKATKARGPVTIGAVVVTGHTDRIGSLKYNMKLSEKRAVVVKDYLVSKGVDQKLIFWEGKGPKQPIPVTKFCDNKMKRKQLIECLAPNRRVTVEAVGRAQSLAKPKPAAKKPAAKK
ncbi:MAG TPA: OmpA family protein [Burkholderiales bacterium]|nr:OmpA family protein [Burkholderiales bacterium]